MNEALPEYTLDASVALKWLLRLGDEPYLEQADLVARDFREGRINLIAPVVIEYEVGHALSRAIRRGRITQRDGDQAHRNFHRFEIPTFHDQHVTSSAWTYVRDYGVSFYDGAYLAVASSRRAPLIHADEKLRDRLAGDLPERPPYTPAPWPLPHLIWIEDYQPVRSSH